MKVGAKSMEPHRRVARVALWGALVLAGGGTLVGCATGSETVLSGEEEATSSDRTAASGEGEASEEPSEYDADPMLIRGGDTEGKRPAVDSQEVFQKAYDAYSNRRYEEAIEHYEFTVEYFPDSRFYQPALYNAGLTYEKLERWEAAAEKYRRIIEEFPKKGETNDAYFRLARVLEQLERPQAVLDTTTEVLLRDGLDRFDRVEGHVRRGNALLELGQLGEAEDDFKQVLELNEEASPSERLPSGSRYIVQTYFGLGRVYHERHKKIALTLPPESMGDELDRKAKLLLSAQTQYLTALRQHHPKWSMAAGYMVGKLYEDFYSDVFSAEIPEGLTDEQVAMYFEELRSRIKPLMERAIEVYEKNLSLSKRIGESADENRWVEQTRESLRRLKHYKDHPLTQKQAQRLVREGRDFRSLWRPWDLASDEVERAVERATEKSGGRASGGRGDATSGDS